MLVEEWESVDVKNVGVSSVRSFARFGKGSLKDEVPTGVSDALSSTLP